MRRPPLLLLLGFSALLPMVLLATGLGWAVLQQQQVGLRAAAFDAVDDVAQEVEGGLRGELNVLQTMADAPELDQPLDETKFRDFAARLLQRNPLFRRIILTNPAGSIVFSYPDAGANRALIEPASHAKLIKTRRPIVGSVRIGPHGHAAFAIRAPVVRGGAVAYVLSAVVAANAINAFLGPAQLPEGGIAFIADSEGKVAARTVQLALPADVELSPEAMSARASAPRGFYYGSRPPGEPVAGVFVDIPSWGWSVHVTIPKAIYIAPIRTSIWILASGSSAAILVAGAAILLLLREMRVRRSEALALEGGKRIEVLGRLTGGVAHDFNNILMVIQGGADAIGRRVKSDEKVASFLAMILASCQRGQSLTRQLLAFARRGAHAPVAFDFVRRIEDVEVLVKQAVGPRVRLRLRAAPGLWPIFADPDALDIALTNLAVNARDAMPDGGDLEIAAYNAAVAAGDRRLGDLVGDFVVVSVRDTGGGIDPQHIAHVFDPFFTTKPVGEGVGLGLSQVFGFAKQSGGAVLVESALRKGTRFDIYLPRAQGVDEVQAEPRATAPARGRVLLVEDSKDVARVVEDGLIGAGFEVTFCDRAALALDRLRNGECFDVALSDMTMAGGVSGVDFAETVRASWPALPVVLMTGYSDRVEDAARVGAPVLSKPFSPRELVDALMQEISRRRPPAV